MEDMQSGSDRRIRVAVDLGSTTIAVICWDMVANQELFAFSFSNPQVRYGTDVITRIKYCMENADGLKKLSNIVKQELNDKLKMHLDTRFQDIQEIVITGNPIMIHIMRGLSINGFASTPFQTVDLNYAEEVNDGIIKMFLPGLSAFVGSDLLAGVEFLNMGNHEKYDFIIDLGTNGEIILLNTKVGYATSTACGTVFDSTIVGARYGSECIKAISNCIKSRLIDKKGKIVDVYFDKGIKIDRNFVIRQQNVRNFQLAKGAIFSGIQCLMKKANITYDQIENVYISGGLGFYMDNRDAFTVKMLPKEFYGKIIIAGNTSLKGGLRYLTCSKKERIKILSCYEKIRERITAFELAKFNDFQDVYLNSLNF